jgi:hypothetical protein
MEKQQITKTKRRVKELQKKMAGLGPVMRGSVVILGKKQQTFFSLNKDKKTRLIYLDKEREAIARDYSSNYKKLLAIVEEMTLLNMELLRKSYDD